MDFEGLSIKAAGEQKVKEVAPTPSLTKEPEVSATDYIVDDAGVGEDILKQVKNIRNVQGEEVIYGVYDNSQKGLMVRINDFFIDNQKIGIKDKSYFFHMLAVMVDAGIPVVKAVQSLAYRTENRRFKRILYTIAHNCEAGTNLSDAMSRFDDVFDDAELGIVKSGEATGHLDSMLFRLSDQLDKRHDLETKLWGAAVYPIIVLIVLLLVAVGMLVWIFPTLLNLLKEGGVSNAELPLPTRVLIGLQNAVIGYWWAILLVLFGFYGVFSIYVRSSYGAVRFDFFKLNIPIVGSLIRKVQVLRSVSLLGILVESGLPVIKALQITGNSLSNRLYKLKMQEVINHVRDGQKISYSMADSQFLYPPEIVQMIAVGEKSASLGKISEKIANQYQREIDNSLKKLSAVFEPVMILFVGLFVALLALAIMAPIFNLNSVVS
ncbi:type II secretion system F family protein [Candidatus Peregrinibacteria bacterium]|nr:type II secretion system F family protein [Candidatus Peregrinibacteria bacterium]